MKRKSLLIVLTLVLTVGLALAGCGAKEGKAPEQTPNNENPPTTNEPAPETPSVKKGGEFRLNLHSEPPTLDPGQAQDNTSGTVLDAIYEGLVNVDEEGKIHPGVAEKWDVSEDGLNITFHLNKNAKWSNGDPVTAHDFEYAWKKVLDPKTEPAPPYAYQLYYLKNAENYNLVDNNPNHIDDPNQVGVKAADDYTLEVTLENPTPYFIGLTSFYTYYPLHSSTKDNDKWAAEASTIISNGPFKIASWQHNNSIELVPNENYHDKDKVNLDKVKFVMIDADATELSMYQTGQLDYAGGPTGAVPTDQIPSLQQSLPDEMKIQPYASVYNYIFNNKAEPFDNANIRKAFAMAIDRKNIVEKVTLGGQVPAYGWVAPGLLGAEKTFREEHSESDYFKEDYEEAKALLQKGMEEKGYTKLPEITLIHNQSDGHKKIAQAIADMWKQNLGVEVKIEQQEWGVFLKNRTNGNYQVARSGWGADYNDPMTMLDMWMTGNGNNDTFFSNAEYDNLLKETRTMTDPKARMENFAKAEKILIQDNMALMPIYYYTNVRLVKPYVKGVYIDYKGNIHFNNAYLDK